MPHVEITFDYRIDWQKEVTGFQYLKKKKKSIIRAKFSTFFLSLLHSHFGFSVSSNASQSSLMLCTNFRIKTFYLNGNSNPTGMVFA